MNKIAKIGKEKAAKTGAGPAVDDAHGAPSAHRTKKHKTHKHGHRPPFECIALLLQGGGALGSYQAGVYEALAEADIHPDWVAGISIGAVNSAIIAGNPPESRVDKLRAFWESVTTPSVHDWFKEFGAFGFKGDYARTLSNQVAAINALMSGAADFFKPRFPPPHFQPPGTVDAISFYDLADLKGNLERLVDFDRINAGETRLSVGAVNVRSGNFVYFDSETHHIKPEHIMASGALPPGFPAIEIEGEFYWDGGLISNTPLQWVLESPPRRDTLAFQIDLWSARGEFPNTIDEALVRIKEIQYSSRTRANTDNFKRMQHVRAALAKLLPDLPDALKTGPEYDLLRSIADHKVYNVVHMIYRAKHHEGHSKDYEFSRQTMKDHWEAGYHDAVRTLRHPELFERPHGRSGVATFDLAIDGRE
jgi:NTE family protein